MPHGQRQNRRRRRRKRRRELLNCLRRQGSLVDYKYMHNPPSISSFHSSIVTTSSLQLLLTSEGQRNIRKREMESQQQRISVSEHGSNRIEHGSKRLDHGSNRIYAADAGTLSPSDIKHFDDHHDDPDNQVLIDLHIYVYIYLARRSFFLLLNSSSSIVLYDQLTTV